MKDYNIHTINAAFAGRSIESFLKGELKLSRRTISSLKRNQSLRLNGGEARTNMQLKEGDILEITLAAEESESILPEPMELDIVYEDEYLIVINKPYAMPVHPTKGHIMGTLANGLVYYWMNNERSTVIRPVNRLDKDTSGLVVFAKNSHIQHLLSLSMGKPEFKKRYTAIVDGSMEGREGTVDAPIAREIDQRIKRVVREDGDSSVTHYQVLECYKDAALLDIILETGRTHQIRVHLSYIGHPLIGDTLYGGSDRMDRHALHAYEITMKHPINSNWLKLSAEMPKDMKDLLECLRRKE